MAPSRSFAFKICIALPERSNHGIVACKRATLSPASRSSTCAAWRIRSSKIFRMSSAALHDRVAVVVTPRRMSADSTGKRIPTRRELFFMEMPRKDSSSKKGGCGFFCLLTRIPSGIKRWRICTTPTRSWRFSLTVFLVKGFSPAVTPFRCWPTPLWVSRFRCKPLRLFLAV